jgi:hypothetical protein
MLGRVTTETRNKRINMRNAGTRLHTAYATRLLSECSSGNSPLCPPAAFCLRLEHVNKSECVPNAVTIKGGKMQSSMTACFSQYTYKLKLLRVQRLVVRTFILEQVDL